MVHFHSIGAGKGLAAALFAAVVHGAVRAVSAGFDGTNHGTLARQVNELLVARSADYQFVTIFWAFLASRLVADLARFRGRTAIEDDATLMLVEILPDDLRPVRKTRPRHATASAKAVP